MTLADAQAAVRNGSPFGAVYELTPGADRAALKAWFAADPDVPVNRTGPPARASQPAPDATVQARDQGYTGDGCSTCHSMRMRRNGSCLLCEACGSTSGCS